MIKGIGRKVYIGGICGISLSTIANILKANGHMVCGSDEVAGGEIYYSLVNEGIEVFSNLTDQQIKRFLPDSYIYSVAIKEDNPEYIYAMQNSIEIIPRGQALGFIAKEYEKVVAIGGTHGKTTSTSLVSHVLLSCGFDPTCHIGGVSKNLESNHRIGVNNDIFVTEACEYFDSFLYLRPYISVVLNIGEDHMDYFKSVDNLKLSFLKFIKNTMVNGFVIVNIDDNNIRTMLNDIPRDKNVITYSIENGDADVCITSCRKLYDGKLVFDCSYFGLNISEIYLPLVGKHNLYNALVSVIVAKLFGIADQDIRKSIASFEGVERRYEHIGKVNGASVIHDYAHHPDEINAVIEEAKSTTSGNVYVVFQPHTYSRTKTLWCEFSDCLKKAYRTILYPIYPAREQPIDGVSSENLCKFINENNGHCYFIPDYATLLLALKKLVKADDTVLILGAGDVVGFKKYLLTHQDYL